MDLNIEAKPPLWFKPYLQAQQQSIIEQKQAHSANMELMALLVSRMERIENRQPLNVAPPSLPTAVQQHAGQENGGVEALLRATLDRMNALEAQLQRRGDTTPLSNRKVKASYSSAKPRRTRANQPVISLLDDSDSSGEEVSYIHPRRAPRWRGKDLEEMRTDHRISDRSNPVKWLIAYRGFSRTEQWPREYAKEMLPKLWDDGKSPDSRSSHWQATMAGEVRRMTLDQLEQAFLAHFARNAELKRLRQELLTSQQPLGLPSGDWVRRLFRQYRHVIRWSPARQRATPEDMIRSLHYDERFTCPHMIEKLFETGVYQATLTEAELLEICDEADNLALALKNSRAAAAAAAAAHVSRIADEQQAHVSRLAEEQPGSLDHRIDEVEQALAAQMVHEGTCPRIDHAIRRIREDNRLRPREELIAAEDVVHWGWVIGAKHGSPHPSDGGPQREICSFFSTCGNGCSKANCKMPHKLRINKPCPKGWEDTLKCPRGSHCELRHNKDEYPVLKRSREHKDQYVMYMLKDTESPFSIHYKK